MRNLLFSLLLLSLCGCKQEIICPDTYDPATMEFRQYMMSLDGKYRFRKLYINGVDSSAILDSIRIKNEVLNTRDYDIPLFVYKQGCEVVEQFLQRSNTKEFRTGANSYISYTFGMATKQMEPGTLVLELYGENYSRDINGSRINEKTKFIRDLYSREYKLRIYNDTLSLTLKSSVNETKLILY